MYWALPSFPIHLMFQSTKGTPTEIRSNNLTKCWLHIFINQIFLDYVQLLKIFMIWLSHDLSWTDCSFVSQFGHFVSKQGHTAGKPFCDKLLMTNQHSVVYPTTLTLFPYDFRKFEIKVQVKSPSKKLLNVFKLPRS